MAAGTDCVGGPVTNRYTATWDTIYTSYLPIGDSLVPLKRATNNGTFILAHLDDFDSDGVPDLDDNCPKAPNPSQLNCNADAEIKYGYPEAGDRCDPIPCAAADLPSPKEVVVQVVEDQFHKTTTGRLIRDVFTVVPHGSNYVANGVHNSQLMTPVKVPAVPVSYRFCEINTGAGIFCGDEAIDESLLDKLPSGNGPDANAPWLPATMTTTLSGPSPVPFTTESLDHPLNTDPELDEGKERRWLYEDDFLLWKAKIWITDSWSCMSGHGCGTNLGGRFWIHSATTEGIVDPNASPPYSETGPGCLPTPSSPCRSELCSWPTTTAPRRSAHVRTQPHQPGPEPPIPHPRRSMVPAGRVL